MFKKVFFVVDNIYRIYYRRCRVIESIQKFLNGDQYYSLSKDEKKHLRDEEYNKILGSYILIANSFIAFGLVVIILAVRGIMNIPAGSSMFYPYCRFRAVYGSCVHFSCLGKGQKSAKAQQTP